MTMKILGIRRGLQTGRARRPLGPGHPYVGQTEIAGPVDPNNESVVFRSLVVGRKRLALTTLLLINSVVVMTFLYSLIVGTSPAVSTSDSPKVITLIALAFVVTCEVLRLVQTCGLCLFAFAARDPVPMKPLPGLRVAALTTIVPTHEPMEMVAETLKAMRNMSHSGTLDVWVLDEENAREVQVVAAMLGVRYFSRHGDPELNADSGPFRSRTKAGNHNAWRSKHGSAYDIVAQVDPDHVPDAEFLHRTLGYFRDPDVAFVVAPQVYGNADKNFVARAAAAQGYLFTGIVQRGGNGLGAPLLIGTNHLYRMSAWNQINGYQDSIIEDHLTGMVVQDTVNASTGRRWSGIYTPDILAIGEGPETWSDYFRQQNRWAAGVWQIIRDHNILLRKNLTHRQQFAYAFLQSFYPSVGLCWFLGNCATICYITGLAKDPSTVTPGWAMWLLWCATAVSWMAIFSWFRQWYLDPDERKHSLFRPLMATILTAPVYTSAGITTLLRRPLKYAVTGKGRLRTSDTLKTFESHIFWALLLSGAVAMSALTGRGGSVSRGWAIASLCVCLMLPAVAFVQGANSSVGEHVKLRFRVLRRRSRRRHKPPLPLRLNQYRRAPQAAAENPDRP
jgi:cellulose synthase (UDP-forming)